MFSKAKNLLYIRKMHARDCRGGEAVTALVERSRNRRGNEAEAEPRKARSQLIRA